MSEHARLSASGAHRWLRCPASVDLEATLPDPGSRYAEEGTKAHELAERALKARCTAMDVEGDYPADMRAHVQTYVDYVAELVTDPDLLWVERRVDYGAWVPDSFGTSDAMALVGTTLHTIDLKYGAGVRVDAKNNAQGRLYGLGAYDALSFIADIDCVATHIVQPRLDHISTETLSADELLKWGDEISKAARRTLDPDPPFAPGEVQCRFCRAKSVCAARANANMRIAQEEFSEPCPSPSALTLEQIAALLPRLDEMKRWADDVQQYALGQALDGQPVSGYKLVEGRSIRQWRDEDDTIKALRKLKYTERDFLKKKLLSITEIEKLLGGKAKAKPVLETLIHKPEGKPALAPEADKRPALQSAASARDDFNQAA